MNENKVSENNNRVRDEFLSRMSHEMMTPMNAIIGLMEILKVMDDPREREIYHNRITEAAHQLHRQIQDLLDISKNVDDRFELNEAPFAFKIMIRRILDNISADVRKKHHTLNFEIAPLIHLNLIGDENRLAQLITNLLDNSIKFTPENGQISLSGCVLEEDSESITIQLDVTDNGIGISKEQQEKIFQLFEQADTSVTRGQDGAGLGLPVAKRIAEMLGGNIRVDSELGKGSKFIFTFKMKKG